MVGMTQVRIRVTLGMAIMLAPVLVVIATVWSLEEPERVIQPRNALIRPLSHDAGQSVYTATNCRFGVSQVPAAWQSLPWMPTLAAGWYANFTPYDGNQPSAEFVFTVRVRQVRDGEIRYPEYTVVPPLVEYYEEGGITQPGMGRYLETNPGAV